MNAKFTFINRKKQVANFDFDAQVSNFLFSKKIEKRTEKTLLTYRQTLEAFRKWMIEREISEITPETMRDYIHYLTYEKRRWDDHPTSPVGEVGLSPRGVNNIIRILNIFFNYLVSERVITNSPMENIKYQPEDNDTFEVFTDDDVMRLLSAPNRRVYTGWRDYCMMLTLIDTGLRIKELTSMKVSDIDFKLRQIVVRAEVSKTKTARVVPVSNKTLKELERLIEYMNIEKDDYVWLTQFGERYYADTFAKMLKKYGKKAGIEDARVSPHTFRHYFAVKFLKSGGDPIALMRILGHTSLTMTERYVKYTKSDLSEQHEKASPVVNLIGHSNERKSGKKLFK